MPPTPPLNAAAASTLAAAINATTSNISSRETPRAQRLGPRIVVVLQAAMAVRVGRFAAYS